MNPRSIFICLLAAAGGCALGWWWQQQRPVPSASPAPVVTQSTAAAPTSASRAPAALTSGPFAHLAVQLSESPRIQRWLLLVAAVEKARVEHLPDLLRLCGDDRTAQRMIAARWATLDPAHMWRTLVSWPLREPPGSGLATSEYADLLLETWLVKDREAALAAVTKDHLGGVNGASNLRMNLLQRLLKEDPGRTLDLLAEWNIKHYGADFSALGTWAEQNPRLAAEKAAKLLPSYTTASVLKTVGEAWAKTDPAAALQFSTTLFSARRLAFAEGVMAAWTKREAEKAAAYVAALTDPAQRRTLALPMIETWAKTEPQTALDWAQDHLTGEARAEAISKVVLGLAAQDTPRAAELVRQLDPGGAQKKAVAALVSRWAEQSQGDKAAQWLLTLPAGEARDQGLTELAMRWFWNDAKALAQARDLTTGPQRDQLPAGFIAQIAYQQARTDPAGAMQWIEDLAPAHQPLARDRVLSDWMSSRPDAAAQWVLAQPAGPTRADLITTMTRQLAWQPNSAAAKQFLAQLPAADHPAARAAFSGPWRPNPEQAKLLEALKKIK